MAKKGNIMVNLSKWNGRSVTLEGIPGIIVVDVIETVPVCNPESERDGKCFLGHGKERGYWFVNTEDGEMTRITCRGRNRVIAEPSVRDRVRTALKYANPRSKYD